MENAENLFVPINEKEKIPQKMVAKWWMWF
jgi:hypothetical protein